MIAYAGIGSRQITASERTTIERVARRLAAKGAVCYSGHAEGSDQAFEVGSGGKCVLLVPWKNFNRLVEVPCLARLAVGDTIEGNASIDRFHPAPLSLSRGGRLMMARNWHQIHGFMQWPRVSFVVCCAHLDAAGDVVGGTGQACRIAAAEGIPVLNLRHCDLSLVDEWLDLRLP